MLSLSLWIYNTGGKDAFLEVKQPAHRLRCADNRMVDIVHRKVTKVLLVEPFYGGSHKQLVDLLESFLPECSVVTMTAKKWHWRARTAALSLADMIPHDENYRTLFCSSVLNLTELVALRPDLAKLRKVVYFHENQLVYPVRKNQDRDFQYGYNQILTCLTADEVLFNSEFNKDSFLTSIKSFLKLMPDYRPKGLAERIGKKSKVVYFPVDFDSIHDNSPHSEECENFSFNVSNRNYKTETDHFDVTQSKRRKEEIHLSQDNDECVKLVQTSVQNDLKCDESKACKVKVMDSSYLSCSIKDKCGNNSCVNTGNKGLVIKSKQNHNEHDEMKTSHSMNNDDDSEGLDFVSESDRTKPVFSQGQDGVVLQTSCSDSGNMILSQQNDIENSQGTDRDQSYRSVIQDKPMDSEDIVRTDLAREKCIVKPIGCGIEKSGPLHIVWAHRWEHDKDPETFLRVMIRLHNEGLNFRLSVLGEQFTDVPGVFTRAKEELSSKIVNWGFMESKTEYYRVLKECDVAVSTAVHEFFGVSMLEAVYLGCYPLCPNRLVYPEIYPKCYLYNTETQFYKRLRNFCLHPVSARNHKSKVELQRYHSSVILQQIADILSD